MRRAARNVRRILWLGVLATSVGAGGLVVYADMPADFVYLREIDPSIAQDIRYAGTENFIGHPLPGYGAAECVLQIRAARALAAVQAELATGTLGETLGLKVYDCYRPLPAVLAMVKWATNGASRSADPRFFPNLPKSALLAQGYIATRSAHSVGIAVDVTLVSRVAPGSGAPVATTPSGPCSGPADDSLDMGTGFDCFDPKAQTANPSVGAAASKHRALLLVAMQRHGFVNYHREWWHFSFVSARPATKFFDFPIAPRSQP